MSTLNKFPVELNESCMENGILFSPATLGIYENLRQYMIANFGKCKIIWIQSFIRVAIFLDCSRIKYYVAFYNNLDCNVHILIPIPIFIINRTTQTKFQFSLRYFQFFKKRELSES